eukprot:2502704-Pleurochrysis_carterae.AAC.3
MRTDGEPVTAEHGSHGEMLGCWLLLASTCAFFFVVEREHSRETYIIASVSATAQRAAFVDDRIGRYCSPLAARGNLKPAKGGLNWMNILTTCRCLRIGRFVQQR